MIKCQILQVLTTLQYDVRKIAKIFDILYYGLVLLNGTFLPKFWQKTKKNLQNSNQVFSKSNKKVF